MEIVRRSFLSITGLTALGYAALPLKANVNGSFYAKRGVVSGVVTTNSMIPTKSDYDHVQETQSLPLYPGSNVIKRIPQNCGYVFDQDEKGHLRDNGNVIGGWN